MPGVTGGKLCFAWKYPETNGCLLEPVSENIVRVVYTGRDEVQNHSCMVEHPEKMSDLQKEEREGKMILSYGKIRAEIEKGSGTISWYRNDSGKKLLQEGEKA